MNFTKVFTEQKASKKNKRKFYINTMGVQGEDQTKIPDEDLLELRIKPWWYSTHQEWCG